MNPVQILSPLKNIPLGSISVRDQILARSAGFQAERRKTVSPILEILFVYHPKGIYYTVPVVKIIARLELNQA